MGAGDAFSSPPATSELKQKPLVANKVWKTERRRYLHSGGTSSKSRPEVVLSRQGSVFSLEGFVHFPAGLQLDNCGGE